MSKNTEDLVYHAMAIDDATTGLWDDIDRKQWDFALLGLYTVMQHVSVLKKELERCVQEELREDA